GVKKRISERTGYKPQTIDNYISTLKRLKIIGPTAYKGIYMINPEIFGKGDWKDIYKYRAKYKKLFVTFEITNEMTSIKEAKINVACVDDNEKIELVAKSRNISTEELLEEIAAEEDDFLTPHQAQFDYVEEDDE
ncbi:replication/maintenance protein RepL, partial [Pseudomonas poae]|uniref:replication/maintenance protein RepL n=1 Tax=Pseudomonas poae TaxID=200451 RepID=UPI0034D67B6B